MAFGKARSSKRSSSSYTSTVTMVIFIAICVIGLWMLTSSFIPRQTTSTANDLSSSTNSRTHYQHKDPPAFEDSQGDLPDVEPKQMVEMSNYDSKSREDKQSSVLLPENRSDPVVEGNAEDETELENIEASNDDGNPKSSNNEEHEKDQSSLEEENTVETQQRKEESADVEQQAKEESETEEKQEIYAQSEQQTTEVQSTERTQQDTQQETAELESQENTDHSQQQISQEDHQEISDFQNAEIHEGISEPEIRQVMNEETVLQEQQESEQQDETTDNEESQQSERTEAEKQEGQQGEENDNSSNQETQQQEQDILTEEKEMDLNSGESFLGEAQSETQQQGIMTEEKAATDLNSGGESFPGGAHPEIPRESIESKQSWSTQAVQSENEKERRKKGPNGIDGNLYGYTWELCNVTAGPDYIPCLDNEKALKKLHSTGHYEHRERHCPDEAPTCLVPLPDGYKRSIEWPKSRDKIWYHNVPRTKLAEVKGHQNWVKVTGEFLTFPGGGTQFIHGALHYIDFIQQSVPKIGWGKRSRVILDVGCGVASFGGYLFGREVLTMSFAPKDEHEAQVQFALERGIPAMSAVMGSQRLPFPSRVFDLVHCARCRVPWHVDDGILLLEINRVLRPGGYFVWSATPVYQNLKEDVEIWKAMSALTLSMCWNLVTIKKDKLNSIGAAIYRKPITNECYNHRKNNSPPMCKDEDDPNAAWYVPLQSCLQWVPVAGTERGSQWPEEWPQRLETPPYWLNRSQIGIYGKPASDDFAADYEHWKRVVRKSYLSGLGISWSNVRNVMDMRAVYGGFAAALKDLKLWVMNVVTIDSPDTLPIIYERGLFGIYHDWCESFSTYPRSYDLLHADHLFSRLKKRCNVVPVMAEIDRIVKPGGKLIVRDESSIVGEVENILKSLHWEVRLIFSKDQEGILSAQKSDWRPRTYSASS